MVSVRAPDVHPFFSPLVCHFDAPRFFLFLFPILSSPHFVLRYAWSETDPCDFLGFTHIRAPAGQAESVVGELIFTE